MMKGPIPDRNPGPAQNGSKTETVSQSEEGGAKTKAQQWRVNLVKVLTSIRAQFFPKHVQFSDTMPMSGRNIEVFPLTTDSDEGPEANGKAAVTPSERALPTLGGDEWKQSHYQQKLETVWSEIQNNRHFVQWMTTIEQEQTGWDNTLQQCLRTMLTALREGSVTDMQPGTTPRQRYKRCLTAFRKADAMLIRQKHGNAFHQNSREFLQGFAHVLFASEGQSGFHHNLVQAIRQKAVTDQKEELPEPLASNRGKDLAARLKHTQQLIHSQRAVLEDAAGAGHHARNVIGNLAAGEAGIQYDPYQQGNVPDILLRLQVQDREVTCIRMGTPTRQKVPFTSGIIPEFRCFLESLETGQHHLYINRQRRTGIEGNRSHTLEQLQEKKKLREKITVVTLAADGHFYNQTGSFAGDCSMQTLQKQIVDTLNGNREGFFFPPGLRKKVSEMQGDFSQYLTQCLEETAQELAIEGDTPLSVNQRRAFIFHFLNKTLVESLVQAVHVTTYNNTCKDDIDRGGAANAYLFAVKNRPPETATPGEREDFAKMMEEKTNASAIEVKKREVIDHRHEDLRNALITLDYWNNPQKKGD